MRGDWRGEERNDKLAWRSTQKVQKNRSFFIFNIHFSFFLLKERRKKKKEKKVNEKL